MSAILRPSLSKNNFHPNSNLTKEENAKPIISEWRLALFGLIVSLLVVSVKLYNVNRDFLADLLFERKLVTLQTLNDEGEVMLTYVWTTAARYSRFWLPTLCGFFTTYFTWNVVYLDSNVPGVQPPSPFSPQKYKQLSGHTFHLNYIFAVMVGLLVAFYMFYKGVSISY